MTQIITDNGRSTNAPPSGTKSQRVCRHFARGRCTWGSSCRFSHEVERAALDEPQSGNQAYIGEQQQRLQKERHTILKAALDGEFDVKPYDVAEGLQRHLVQLRISSPPILIPRLYNEETLSQQLIEMEGNDQVRMGGLLFLVGEPSVFWSMMQLYCLRRTTTHSKWDTLLANAKRGCVECMFYRSTVGCLSSDCPFIHSNSPVAAMSTPIPNMATNNALLTPLLGFGTATPSTQKTAHGGIRMPVDSLRYVAPSAVSVTKGDDPVVYRDPVWGPCSFSGSRASAPEHQESFSIAWDPAWL